MNTFQVQYPGQKNALIEADKKNLKNESVILIILGFFFLLIFMLICKTNILYFYFPLTSLYILAGIIGFIGVNKESFVHIRVFRVLIYVIIGINSVFIMLGLIFAAFILFSYPAKCSRRSSDSCGITNAVTVLGIILCLIVIAVSSSLVLFMKVILKHINKLIEDQDSCNFVQYI